MEHGDAARARAAIARGRPAKSSKERLALWALRARLGVAHPSLLGKPFMLGPTNRAVDPCEKDRHGLEALAIRSQTGGDVPSGLRASHHDGSHWPLLAFVVAPFDYVPPVKIV
jgi:hypothetical protein